MAITVPVTDTEIRTSEWGIPITNEVNRMTPLVIAPTAWTVPAFSAGWSGSVQYRKVGTYVECTGELLSSAANPANSVAWTFPVGFRPPANVSWVTPFFIGTVSWTWITVKPTGAVDVQNAITGAGQSVHCACIRFGV